MYDVPDSWGQWQSKHSTVWEAGVGTSASLHWVMSVTAETHTELSNRQDVLPDLAGLNDSRKVDKRDSDKDIIV